MKFAKIFIALAFIYSFAEANENVTKTNNKENNTTCETCKDNIKAPENNGNLTNIEKEFGDTNETLTYDPFEKYNRAVTNFNDKLYIHIMDPIARGYSKVVPEGGRIAIGNFISNLYFPVRFTNNLLQFKINNAAKETGRFVVNSTLGAGGFFDVAKRDFNWEGSDEDLGQTLGFYGIGAGPHIVWPILGQSNLRDTLGMIGDSYINALSNTKEYGIKYKIPQTRLQEAGIYGYEKINKTSLHLGEYESLKKDAIDFYPFLRDAYSQQRTQQIKE